MTRLLARQLALQVHRVLLHARRGAVLVDVADVRADAGQRAEAVARSAAPARSGTDW